MLQAEGPVDGAARPPPLVDLLVARARGAAAPGGRHLPVAQRGHLRDAGVGPARPLLPGQRGVAAAPGRPAAARGLGARVAGVPVVVEPEPRVPRVARRAGGGDLLRGPGAQARRAGPGARGGEAGRARGGGVLLRMQARALQPQRLLRQRPFRRQQAAARGCPGPSASPRALRARAARGEVPVGPRHGGVLQVRREGLPVLKVVGHEGQGTSPSRISSSLRRQAEVVLLRLLGGEGQGARAVVRAVQEHVAPRGGALAVQESPGVSSSSGRIIFLLVGKSK
mmetsp:Transcript_34978/g.93643  ORF Transcript_34978/g.93643 Transcript_34978/m.93643 type:complete len:282 (-) Transcript_34978:94-939(-)